MPFLKDTEREPLREKRKAELCVNETKEREFQDGKGA